MVREREGKILFVEDKCYLKFGFEGNDGKFGEKIIAANKIISFLNDPISEGDCFKITEEHKKVDIIRMFDRCQLERKAYKDIEGF